jgi:hypothetical protein
VTKTTTTALERSATHIDCDALWLIDRQIHIDFTSAAELDSDGSLTPVRLQFSAGGSRIYIDGSGKYVGLLDLEAIQILIQTYEVTLTTSLSSPRQNKKNSKNVLLTKKTLHIVVYAVSNQVDQIGDFLEESGLFLQHPTEYDTRFQYINPQYLLRPGSSMPRPEHAAFQAISVISSSDRRLEDAAKDEVQQVFDLAVGPNSFSEIEPSPRIQTTLKEYVSNLIPIQ